MARCRNCNYYSQTAVAVLLLLEAAATALTTPTSTPKKSHPPLPRVPLTIVVGKIIVDEYGDPIDRDSPVPPQSVTIGGGGPQAAWGAAAALAVWTHYVPHPTATQQEQRQTLQQAFPTPPTQPVLFCAPVGNDWSLERDSQELMSLLHDAVEEAPILLQGDNDALITPRIRIWHDDKDVVQWYAMQDSFGPKGADGLWRDRPSAQDILDILDEYHDDDDDDETPAATLHLIGEASQDAAGGGWDSKWLGHPAIQELRRGKVGLVGVEPIAFLDPTVGRVADTHARSCADLLHNDWLLPSSSTSGRNEGDDDDDDNDQKGLPNFVLCPDIHLDRALRELELYRNNNNDNDSPPQPTEPRNGDYIIATRDGANGSKLTIPITSVSSTTFYNLQVPAATLATNDGTPVNPTGAGNAFSAALTALLGAAATIDNDDTMNRLQYCAAIATGIGALVCEHDHLPPWSWESMDRIWEAAQEVQGQIHVTATTTRTKMPEAALNVSAL